LFADSQPRSKTCSPAGKLGVGIRKPPQEGLQAGAHNSSLRIFPTLVFSKSSKNSIYFGRL
jgi:hypothetical protein